MGNDSVAWYESDVEVSMNVMVVVTTVTESLIVLVSVTSVEVYGPVLAEVTNVAPSEFVVGSDTGHTVVEMDMISVVTEPNCAGQFVTSGAQDVTV